MTVSQDFPRHIKLLNPLRFLFFSLFFVFFCCCCFVSFWFQVQNERMRQPQMNWFSCGKNFGQIQFFKRGPRYVACNSFCKYLTKQPYAKFVLFWPNCEILRRFDFEKSLKIPKFSNLLNGKIISIEVNH